MQAPSKKTDKKTPGEPYKEVRVFPETGEVALFKKRIYEVGASIGMNSSRMRSIECGFVTGMCQSLIEADILDPSWLDIIRQHDMSDIRSACNTVVKVTQVIAFYLLIGKYRTHINFSAVNNLFVPVRLGTIRIDRFMK